jgi:hypothetical protein
MNRIFEIIEKAGINNKDLKTSVLQKVKTSNLLEMAEGINEYIYEINPNKPVKTVIHNPYDFLASASISCQTESDCFHSDCRISRINPLLSFSSLYADVVYIRDYFEDRVDPPKNEFEDERLREKLLGDVSLLYILKPLVDEGIVQFLRRGFHYCSHCQTTVKDKFDKSQESKELFITTLEQEFLPQIQASYFPENPMPPYCFEIFGPDEIFHGGSAYCYKTKITDDLMNRIKHKPSVKFQLTQQECIDNEILRGRFNGVSSDILLTQISSQLSHLSLKYLTGSEIDLKIMQSFNNEEDRVYNKLLRNQLVSELPILENIPLKNVLELRKAERDSLILYRDAITNIIDEYISNNKHVSALEARDIYEDIILPRVNVINAKVNNYRKSLIGKFKVDVWVPTAVLAFGFVSGMFSSNNLPFLTMFGGIPAVKKIINEVVMKEGIQDDVKNDSMYFLWKLTKKQ